MAKIEDLNYVLATDGSNGFAPSTWYLYTSMEEAIKAKEERLDKNHESHSTFMEKDYKPMTWDNFQKLQKEFWCKDGIQDSNEKYFNEALECLPPKRWINNDRYHTFLMSEHYTGSITSQYLLDKITKKYWYKLVDVTDKSTFIEYELGLETLC